MTTCNLLISAHQVDYSSFLMLTEDNLKELVPQLGPRSKLWNTIQQLKNGKVYVCFLCDVGFITLNQLSNHLRVFHRLTQSSSYRCKHCSGLFGRHSFLNHFRNIFKVHRNLLYCDFLPDPDTPIDFDIQGPFVEDCYIEGDEQADLTLLASKLIASILQSGKVPISTSNEIIHQVKGILSAVIGAAKSSILKEFTQPCCQLSVDKVIHGFENLANPFKGLESRYKLDKYLSEKGYLIEAKQIVLDTDISFNNVATIGVRQKYKPITMQYVSIRESIAQLLNKPGFYNMLELNKSYNGDMFTSFRDGKLCSTLKIPKNSIFINLYFDEVEVANPLGSRSGKHKLSNFYFSILDMPKYMLSSVDNVLFLASLKSVDMKFHSPNKVMQIIVDELLELYRTGIDFQLNGETLNVKVVLAQLSGDNLGIHSVLGFTEGFTANFPCRRCKLHKTECQKAICEVDSKLRTIENYDKDLHLNTFSMTGINFESVLNKLPYHHVTNMVVFDVMHDILEGVATDLIVLVIRDCIQKKYFTYDKLNYRIESFNYGRHYCNSKPSLFKQSFLKGETKSGQNASQTMCLLYCLPMILGDLVKCDSEGWNLLLLLIEIFGILLSPSISKSGILYLNSIISEFLYSYQDTFKKTLKPKHHHLLHYASSIELIGPLRYFWSMTFESKHKFFRTSAHVSCNFKNVAKTVAYRHQLARCFRLLSKDEFSPCDFSFDSSEEIDLESFEFKHVVHDRFNISENAVLKTTDRVHFNGIEYRCGCIIYFKSDGGEYRFGRVECILLESDECNLIIYELASKFDSHFSAHRISSGEESRLHVVDIHDLAYFVPMYEMSAFKLNDMGVYVILPIKIM